MQKTMATALTKRSMTRTALLSLVLTLVQGMSDLPAQDNGSGPLVAAALLVPGGPAVYLGSGLLLTAAHLVNPGADITVVIARAKLPAKVLKQGVYEDIDLSLLHVDQSKLPPTLPTVQLCSAPPWPGDPVIVINAGQATRSTITAPSILPPLYQHRFPTLIKDVATTGNSGSGVFDATKKCLLGVMSRKFTVNGKDIAKYFVSADLIRVFMKGIELPKDNPDDTEKVH
jgi:S1-C subfamily serine protease